MNAEPTKDVSHHHTPEIGWGTPVQPSRQATPPAGPNGWTTVRRILLWSVLVLGVAGIGLGLFVIADDLAETTDMWHGLGIAIGAALAVACLVLCVLAGFGLRSMRRRGAAGGRPQAVVIGLLLLAPGLFGGLSWPFVGLSSFLVLPLAVGALLLLSVLAQRS